jgi:hypothetical protein
LADFLRIAPLTRLPSGRPGIKKPHIGYRFPFSPIWPNAGLIRLHHVLAVAAFFSGYGRAALGSQQQRRTSLRKQASSYLLKAS